jgi:membrane-bound serine protease (ClpP class)
MRLAKLVVLISALLFAGALFLRPAAADEDAPPHRDQPLAYEVVIKGGITPATVDFVKRSLKAAADAHADIIVLRMDTPGGYYDSMKEIIQDIIVSPVAVAGFVAPQGSRAASAGTYILYACHVAAMAPSTDIGAATPINLLDEGRGTKSPDPQTTLERKLVNDAAAYIRGLAQLRNRNGEWAERAVRQAESLSANEALSKKAIDLIAHDVPDLLSRIDGRTLTLDKDKTVKLRTRGASIVTLEPDWRQHLLETIATPNMAFALTTLGVIALLFEVFHPGLVLPGVVGAICLTLGLFAMNVLPINYAGLTLLVLGVGLMAAEAFAPSFGALGLGGAVAFALGATMLFNSSDPSFAIDPMIIGGVTMICVGVLSVLLTIALRAQRRPVTTGVEALRGSTAEVVKWSQGRGEVRAAGELWQAQGSTEFIINPGDRVTVVDVAGLSLVIKPK